MRENYVGLARHIQISKKFKKRIMLEENSSINLFTGSLNLKSESLEIHHGRKLLELTNTALARIKEEVQETLLHLLWIIKVKKLERL